LTQQTHALVGIERDHGGAAGVVHHIKLGVMSVWQHDLIDGHVHDASAKVTGALEWSHATSLAAALAARQAKIVEAGA
jgi:hypothetical protein